MGPPLWMLLVMGFIGATARPCRRAAQLLVAVTLVFASGRPAGAEAPRLGLPVACEPDKTCFIQHYFDVAPQAGTQDFRCGHSTYKGHDGVDFRVLSAAAARQGIAVVAAAPGVVKGRRDGMADAFPREVGRDAIKNRECGNGVVIDHGGGWETQYCHMRQGSVKVTAGQQVERGTPLGDVGYSGLADSAHLHLTVRQNGKAVDPFTGKTPDGACLREGAATTALFDDSVLRAFPYADGIFLQTGFAARPLTWAELELDHTSGQQVAP
ncbi:MAG: M23 family metallopeptidase, partial [Hyphomicrobiaceae bacterium]